MSAFGAGHDAVRPGWFSEQAEIALQSAADPSSADQDASVIASAILASGSAITLAILELNNTLEAIRLEHS